MPDRAGNAPTSIPPEMFDRLLETEDLSELKAILQVLRLSGDESPRPVPVADLLAPGAARTIAGPHHPEGAERRAQRAIDRAVANGSLLRVAVDSGTGPASYVFPATTAARTLVERLRAGDPRAARVTGLPADAPVSVYRPNVFAFYEQHLGPLTPLVADQLRDAERSYPRLWIEEAIVAAADSNTRSWRYIETVLARWEETGAPSRATTRQPGER